MTKKKKDAQNKLELVLKCGSAGTVEVVRESIVGIAVPDIEIDVIHAGVGDINKSDVFMAETGSKLITGFEINVMPKVDQLLNEHGVEVRIYEVIYKLIEDIKAIAASMTPQEKTDEIIGSAKVIALFKSSRKGIILGCEVVSGKLSVGSPFRVITAMGPVYAGTIRSLHIGKSAVNKATSGQQVGLKIADFKKAKIGDLVESYHLSKQHVLTRWFPKGKVFYV
jgi:translation initiation factor IF-2